MTNLQLTRVPIAKTGMLIRKPVADVFEAFVDPEITTKFWFTKSSGRLENGATDSTQGFSLVLAGLKALLEHNIRLNLIADRYPSGIEEHS